jgi:hypothetical protein
MRSELIAAYWRALASYDAGRQEAREVRIERHELGDSEGSRIPVLCAHVNILTVEHCQYIDSGYLWQLTKNVWPTSELDSRDDTGERIVCSRTRQQTGDGYE